VPQTRFGRWSLGITLFFAATPAIALQCLVRVDDGPGDSLAIYEITEPAGGQRLIGGGSGLYRYGDGRLIWMSAESARTGAVNRITEAVSGAHLVGSEKGLFRYARGRLVPILTVAGATVPLVEEITEGGGETLVGGAGLFRLVGGRLEPIAGGSAGEIGTVAQISEPVGDERLVRTSNGLFRYTAGRLLPLAAAGTAVSGVMRAENGTWLVGSINGMFRYRGGGLTPVPGGEAARTGAVHQISEPLAGVRLVNTGNGLFRFSGGRLEPVRGGSERDLGGTIQHIGRPTGDRWIVSAPAGLLIYDEQGLRPLPSGRRRGDIGYSFEIVRVDTRETLIVTESGLYRYLDNRLELIPGSQGGESGIYEIAPLRDGERLVALASSLARYVQRPALRARQAPGNPDALAGDRPTILRWILAGDCAEYATRESFLLKIDQAEPAAADFSYDPTQRMLTLTIAPRIRAGSQRLAVFARDSNGRPYAISEALDLKAALNWSGLAVLLAKLAAVVHTLAFLSLILAARWSDRAAAMLMHPLSRSVGLWFGFALTFFPLVQQWLLGRWFDKRKREVSASPFLPLPVVNRERGETVISTELGKKIHPTCRLWLEGQPGMGKTALAREMETRFFMDFPNLATAVRKVGYIPLFVRLRDLSGANLGKGDRMWPARVAEAILGGQGFIADEAGGKNLAFVDAILRRSKFVLILDGANEVAWDKELLAAAVSTDRPGFFVTSQTTPPEAVRFDRYMLPQTMGESVGPLLCLFLGKEEGDRAFEKLKVSPLIEDIRSGYDVRLIESLHRAGAAAFPEDRIALYDMIVGALFAPGPTDNSPDRLYAFAWTLWLKGERQFPNEALDARLRAAVRDSALSVVRVIDGATLEFRHDQMRGYLAAKHVAAAVSPTALLERSEGDWPQARSEQDLVWTFLSDLLDEQAAGRLYKWSLDEPDARIALQAALRRRL